MAQDCGETIDSMQPMRIGDGSLRLGDVRDLAVYLALKAAAFRSSLPVGVRTALAQLVRAMNCYFSNLIEGHDTHPIDIERALRGELSADPVMQRFAIANECTTAFRHHAQAPTSSVVFVGRR